MHWAEAAVWGAAGCFAATGLDIYTALRQHGQMPWKVEGPGVQAGPAAHAIGEVIRMLLGGFVAAAFAGTGQVSGAVAAIVIGIAAPAILQRLVAQAGAGSLPANLGDDPPALNGSVPNLSGRPYPAMSADAPLELGSEPRQQGDLA
jgi:hypothetical protein